MGQTDGRQTQVPSYCETDFSDTKNDWKITHNLKFVVDLSFLFYSLSVALERLYNESNLLIALKNVFSACISG